jgi:hypothetical protein
MLHPGNTIWSSCETPSCLEFSGLFYCSIIKVQVRNALIHKALHIFPLCIGNRFGASAKRSISSCKDKVNHFFKLFFFLYFFHFLYDSSGLTDKKTATLSGIYFTQKDRSICSIPAKSYLLITTYINAHSGLLLYVSSRYPPTFMYVV